MLIYTPRRWLNIHESPSGWVKKNLPESTKIERSSLSLPFLECTKNAPKNYACECFNVYFHQSQSISHTEMKEVDGPLLKFTFFYGKANLFQLSPATMELVRMFWDVEPVLAGAIFFAPMMQLPSKALRTSCSQHLVKKQTLKCCASFNFKPQIWSYLLAPQNGTINFHMFPKLEIGPEQRRDLFANRHPSRPRHESISPSRSLSLSPSAMGARNFGRLVFQSLWTNTI